MKAPLGLFLSQFPIIKFVLKLGVHLCPSTPESSLAFFGSHQFHWPIMSTVFLRCHSLINSIQSSGFSKTPNFVLQ